VDKSHDNWQTHAGADGLTSLGLRVPQQTQAPDNSFLTDAKRTDAWFASLPMANIGESARRIFNALVDCNRMEMTDVVRARVTERFRKPIDYLCKNLERRYTHLGFPLSAKSRKTASLARELNMELAVAYKVIVEKMLGGGKQRFDEKLMVISLHRALFHLGQVLYQSALVYSPWPPSVWREIHGIYAYAAHNEVQDVPVKDSVRNVRGEHSPSIEEVYKSLLILSVTDPLRLRQRQISSVFTQIGRWAHLAQVQPPGGKSKNDKGRFNLDLWSDMPPVHNSLSPPARNRRVRILDMRGLIRSLRENFQPLTDEADRENLENKKESSELIRMLISGWSHPSDRRFVRTHLNFELQLAVGLNAVFDEISEHHRKVSPPPRKQRPAPELQTHSSPLVPTWAASMPKDLLLAPLDSELTSNPVDVDGPLTSHGTAITDHYALDFEVPVEEEEEPEPRSVHTINESAGGYCIRWPNAGLPKVKVGEVIGIQSTSSSQQFGVGIVRWLKQDPARDLEVGLEIIAPRCQTAVIWSADNKSNIKNPPRYNCLLLPESNRGAGDNNLITSATEMDIGVEIWLERGGENRLIRLTRMVEASSLFSRYSYCYTSLDGDGADDSHQFDDLWNNL